MSILLRPLPSRTGHSCAALMGLATPASPCICDRCVPVLNAETYAALVAGADAAGRPAASTAGEVRDA